MCGVFGAVSLHEGSARSIETGRLLEALRHRGPDADGVWQDDRCLLGHLRLSIIDLSEAGRQPMTNEDGTLWLSYNGEIYNFQTLRRTLETRGHRFRSATDTEVVVHAFEEWGTDCVNHFDGMFAFALWDQRRSRLILARDRTGKKPMFYAEHDGRFWFASELQAFLALDGFDRSANLEAVDTYLTYGYVPAPATAFRAVRQLPPAHVLTLDLGRHDPGPRTHRYWSLDFAAKQPLSEQEAAERIRELMSEAVRKRLVSDVPLGAFLSGGIDSSIVVGLMAEHANGAVKTFSVGFSEADYNELAHARRVAQRWDTDHTEFVVRPDAAEVIPRLVRHYGQPFADSSALPTYYVARETSSHVKVALSGDGGDESFAGYERYWGMELAGTIQRLPLGSWTARQIARLLPDGGDFRTPTTRARRFLSAASEPPWRRYAAWSSYFDESHKHDLYGPRLAPLLDGPRPNLWMEQLFAASHARSPGEAAMSADIRSYLPYDLLTKVDIASMMSSLEVRCPFLDTAVMEFAAGLPLPYKLRGRRGKRLLLDAFPDLLPRENVERKKMGFGVPVGRWFRGPLRELLTDTLFDPRAHDRGLFQEGAVRRMVDDHMSGAADHTARLWALLMLELWQKDVADGDVRSRAEP